MEMTTALLALTAAAILSSGLSHDLWLYRQYDNIVSARCSGFRIVINRQRGRFHADAADSQERDPLR